MPTKLPRRAPQGLGVPAALLPASLPRPGLGYDAAVAAATALVAAAASQDAKYAARTTGDSLWFLR